MIQPTRDIIKNNQKTMAEDKEVVGGNRSLDAAEKFDFRLLFVVFGVYAIVSVFLVNTFGLIAAGVVFAFLRKSSANREALSVSVIAGAWEFLREIFVVQDISSRDLSISIVSGIIFALVSYGIIMLIGFIMDRLKKRAN